MICDPKCGLCCSKIPGSFLKSQGLPVNESGVGCANLTPDMKCSIYDTRPDVCRVKNEKVARIACGILQDYYGYNKETKSGDDDSVSK